MLTPARRCKNAPFETVDELRLVYGSTLELLFGEDFNRNGVLDPNEDDGSLSTPADDSNGTLNPGILDLVTVYSSQPNTPSGGSRRINITNAAARPQLTTLFNSQFGNRRAAELIRNIGARALTSVLELYQVSRMTADEYLKVRGRLTSSSGGSAKGLVNVNTASAEVLACIPGLDSSKAATLVSYRQSHPDQLTTLTWVTEALDQASVARAGRYLTDQTYQVSADIAAVGRNGRGYARVRVVFDMSAGSPRIVYREDLSGCGWALGSAVRQSFAQNKESTL
jgi:hypothetical protein